MRGPTRIDQIHRQQRLAVPTGRLADGRTGEADYCWFRSEVGADAAEQDPGERLYRQCPIGPALQRQGITSNEILSQKRAENVMEYVVSLGVRPDLISAQGFGDSNPVASNDTAQGRAQNRRVELSLAGSSC